MKTAGNLLVWAASFTLLLLGGCAHKGVRVNQMKGAGFVEGVLVKRQRQEAPTSPTADAVHVVIPDAVGCIGNCFPISGGTADQKRAEAEATARNRGAADVFLLIDYGGIAKPILAHHLGRLARNVQVEIANQPAAGQPGVVDTQVRLTPGFYRVTVQIVLTATPQSGKQITGEATVSRSFAAHLAWVIPTSLATFPICFAWLGATGRALARSSFERAIVQAVDLAAEQLVAQMRQLPQAAEWKVELSVVL